MNVLTDINVLLDVFLNRAAWLADSAAVLQANHDGRITLHVSASALPTIFYIVRRHAGLPQAMTVVDECLKAFRIVPVTGTTLALARTWLGNDYEDNVQIACAVEARLDAIVTRDPRGFAGSPIPVLTPADLVARLSGGTP
jgi:predicted nucleic acid-binding protein